MRVWIPLSVLGLWALLSVSGQYLSLTPNLIHLENILAAPGYDAPLGFDDLGREIDDRLIVGAIEFSLLLPPHLVVGLVEHFIRCIETGISRKQCIAAQVS